MIRFYSPQIETTPILSETESGHCCRVLRLKEGDIVHVVDGKGSTFECEIILAHPKHTELRILTKNSEQKYWQPSITLAVAPTKSIDRIEWLIEKAVEIGLDKIVFVRCRRSERKDVNIDRLEKIMVSAMKQSMKATLPQFSEMIDFNHFINNLPDGDKYMGYCSEDYPRLELTKEYNPGKNVTILIGPEGDFSPEEVELATTAGFIPVTFGQTRLRTETAALYALTAIHVINNQHDSFHKP